MGRLETADALRSRDPEAAIAAYTAALSELRPEHTDRLLWLASCRLFCPAALDPVLQEAAALAPDDVRLQLLLGLSRMAYRRGDLALADKRYRALLVETRGVASRPRLVAMLNLAQTYRTEGRSFEALVLARRAWGLACDLGDAVAAAGACVHHAGVLDDLGDYARLPAALERLRDAVAVMPDNTNAQTIRALMHGYEARVYSGRDEWQAALDALDRMHAALPRTAYGRSFFPEVDLNRAMVHIERTEYDQAAALLAPLGTCDQKRPDFELKLEQTRLKLLARRDGAAAALPAARAFLDHLAQNTSRIGLGMAARECGLLGVFFARVLGVQAEARRAFDVAARATLARLVELDRAVRELPELASPCAEDREILGAHRVRLAAEQSQLMESVAELLHISDLPPVRLIVRNGLIALCAWCRRVRVGGAAGASDHRWLPVGSYVPDDTQFDLTHGICADCAVTLRNQIAVRSSER